MGEIPAGSKILLYCQFDIMSRIAGKEIAKQVLKMYAIYWMASLHDVGML